MAFNWSGAIDGSYKEAQANPKNWMDKNNSGSEGGANPEQPEQDVLDEKYARQVRTVGVGQEKVGGRKNMQATHNNLSSRQMGRKVALKGGSKNTGTLLKQIKKDDMRTTGEDRLKKRGLTRRENRLSKEYGAQNTGMNEQAATAKKRAGRGI